MMAGDKVMLIVVENTYPVHTGVAHAEPGDICHWEVIKGSYRLIRDSDGKTLFSTSAVNQDCCLIHNNKKPTLIGCIAQNKSKGWKMIIEKTSEVKS